MATGNDPPASGAAEPPAGSPQPSGASPSEEPSAADSPRTVFDLNQPASKVSYLIERAADASDRTSLDKVFSEAKSARDGEELKPYGARDKAQDVTRKTIALSFIGLFCAIVVLSFVALYMIGLRDGFGGEFFSHLKTLLDVLVGPVITMLSSAVGFYFGYQQGDRSQSSAGGSTDAK